MVANYSSSTFGFNRSLPRVIATLMMIFTIIVLFLRMNLSQDTPPCVCTNDMGITTCPYVRACPVNAKIVQIECQTNQLVLESDFTVKQLFIHGECDDIENFKRFCTDEVEEIRMQRNGKKFNCSGIYITNK